MDVPISDTCAELVPRTLDVADSLVRNLYQQSEIYTNYAIIRREGESVEKTWTEFKECILSVAVKVCGMRRRKNQQKRTCWWNNEVKEVEESIFSMDAAEDIRG